MFESYQISHSLPRPYPIFQVLAHLLGTAPQEHFGVAL